MSKYQVMPPLSETEYKALKDDINQNGCLVAVEVDEFDNILDGHNRVQVCKELGITNYPRVIRAGLSEDEKRAHARRLNMSRRHMTLKQKRQIIREQLIETPDKSDRYISACLGVDHKTVGAVRKELEATGDIPQLLSTVGADGKERPRESLRRSPVTVYNPTPREKRAVKNPLVVERMAETGMNARRAEETIHREEKAIRKDISLIKITKEDCQLFRADLRDGLLQIPDSSVNAVIIDPPYSFRDYPDIWEPLAQTAQRVLVPNGVFICMAGQTNLDKKMEAFSKHLRYHWLISYLAERASPNLHWLGVSPRFKAVLWYVKGEYEGELHTDVIRIPPDEDDKDLHNWGQNVAGMEKLVDMFTKGGDTVADFCMGSGTTGVAALKLKRKFIGCDYDPTCVEVARKRIEDLFREIEAETT